MQIGGAGKSRATIYDIAKLAAVSPATVSRVLSGRDSVAAQTKGRVIAAAEELGYRTNSLARSLASRTSDIVAVMLPDITNPFFAELVKSVQAAAFNKGYTTLICNTEDDPELERTYLDQLLSLQVRHVFVIGLTLDRATVRDYVSAKMNFIALDRPMRHATSVIVQSDNRKGAELAVSHLLGLGHRRIAHIAGPASVALSRQRRRGYLNALAAADLEADDALVVRSDFSEEGGANALAELDRRGGDFTAIFAADDVIAMGALSAALASGRIVPNDLSLVGFDDVLPARYTVPPLTTVRQDAVAMGDQAIAVMSATDTEGSRRRRVVLPVALVLRGSTGLPPKRSATL
jgi:LacI family transcriptional regulator